MNTRRLLRVQATFLFFPLLLAACTALRLEDKSAPSLEATFEADYDVNRWNSERKSGWATTPPMRKEGNDDWTVTSFRIRGQFCNSLTWYDADGQISQGLFQGEQTLSAD